MINEIKTMIGDAAAAYTDAQIELAYKQAKTFVLGYCRRRELDEELEVAAQKIAIVRLNRLNTEGLAAQGTSGVSETYLDGIPAEVMLTLNCKRRVKLL
jgi:hypothetical protein